MSEERHSCGCCGREGVPLVFLPGGWEGLPEDQGLCRECAHRIMPHPQVLQGGYWRLDGCDVRFVSDSDSSTAGEKSA